MLPCKWRSWEAIQRSKSLEQKDTTSEACIGYFGKKVQVGKDQDTGYWPIFKGYWDKFFFWGGGYGIFRNFGILEFILGYELN